MKAIFILAVFFSNFAYSAEKTILSIKHLPSMKTVGVINSSECTNQEKVFSGEFKSLKFKCLILDNKKFFTFYENGKEFITLKGEVNNSDLFKNSATVKYLETLIEFNF